VTSASDLAAAALGDSSGLVVGGVSVDQSSVLKETGPVTGNSGVCPPPIPITFMGRTIQLDLFAFLCRFATMISAVVMTVAYLAGGRVWIGSLLA
jgi:hypothetical protein